MKKLLTSLAMGTFIVTSMQAAAFSANNVRTAAIPVQKAESYSACTVDGCNSTGTHQHDGKSYAGHTNDDGHSYHQVCTVKNCTKTSTHDHNGKTYSGHHNEDGHTYHTSTEQHNTAGKHNRHNKRSGHHK